MTAVGDKSLLCTKETAALHFFRRCARRQLETRAETRESISCLARTALLIGRKLWTCSTLHRSVWKTLHCSGQHQGALARACPGLDRRLLGLHCGGKCSDARRVRARGEAVLQASRIEWQWRSRFPAHAAPSAGTQACGAFRTIAERSNSASNSAVLKLARDDDVLRIQRVAAHAAEFLSAR